MDFNKIGTKVLDEETTLGIYVWEIDGKWVGDDEGNYLSITSMKDNKERIEALRIVPDPLDVGNYKDEMKKLTVPGR